MSKITYIGGDLIEEIGGSYKIFAKEGYEITSGKEIIFNAKEGISYGEPQKAPLISLPAKAMVYFRPVSKHGEFGFDWLREDDNGLKDKNDTAYKDIIESGYKNGRTDLTATEAFEKLKTEYSVLHMQFPTTEGEETKPVREYFVPYLTLFSKEYVTGEMKKKYKNLFTEPKYEAELKVLVEIEEEIDKLEFEYDKDFFDIDKKILKDKSKTNGLIPSADISVKITCLKDLPNDMEICIYAYPKECKLPLLERTLAGKIIILQNDERIRKEEKIVLVGVKISVYSEDIITGIFPEEAKYKLYNVLYQSLIIPCIIEDRKKIILDLSKNKDFQKGGLYIKKAKGELQDSRFSAGENNEAIAEMKRLFMNDPKNEIYKTEDYFTIFATSFTNINNNVGGKVEHIGIRNAILFADCSTSAAVHEVLHGLGLYHTHRDNYPTFDSKIKYLYQRDTTTNVMSYSLHQNILWRWQWHLINPNISEK
ncbi:hypothetical protein [Chryseobacterium sp.]|uniref:hypothetical protein n=1 Tax=Chryseobacterium sp. TaxID=1871047 RepID=UPI0028967A14|nr:hypothetical protein [Chryseobacterium sp.]